MSAISGNVSSREVLVFFYKYRKRLVLAFLVPLLLAVVVSFLPVPRYLANSTLVVRLGSEYVYQPEVGTSENGPGTTIPYNDNQIFKAEAAILASDDLHRQVILTIGIDRLFPEIENPPPYQKWMADRKKAAKSFLVSKGLVHDEPAMTADQSDAHKLALAVYMFDKRLSITLEKDSAVITLGFENRDAGVAIQALDTLLRLYFEKRKQLYMQPRAEMAGSNADLAHQRALQAAQAVETYKQKYRIYSLGDQRSQLLTARAELQKQNGTMINTGIDDQIAHYTHQLDMLDSQEKQFNVLQSEAQMAQEAYSQSAKRLDDAQAFEQLQRDRSSSVRVIQPPMAPPEPKKLQPLIILAGLAFSILSTILVAAFTEFFKTGFLTPERLAAEIGLPVIATVPMRRRGLFGR